MTHPILDLQTAMVSALGADAALSAQIGSAAIFDLPPKGRSAPYLLVERHDMIVRDVSGARAHEHNVRLRLWMPVPARSAILPAVERISAVLTEGDLSSATLTVSTLVHVRTDTDMDLKAGGARATLVFRIFSESVI